MKSIIINNEKFKSIFVSVNLLLPLRAEDMSKNALLAMVLKKACDKYRTEKELQRELSGLYNMKLASSVEKYNGVYNISFEMELINKKYIEQDVLERGLYILEQVINNPLKDNNVFNKDIVEREKEKLIVRIKEEQDQKRNYALNKIEELTFDREDYGYPKLGKEQDITKIDEKSLYDYYLKVLKQAEIITIVYGNLDGYTNIKSTLDKYLSNFDLNKKVRNSEIKEIIEFYSAPQIEQESQDISQSVLCFGIRFIDLNEKEIFTASVLNAILGGSPSSKLFKNIREKESLAYYAKSVYNKQKKAIYIISGIEPKNYEKARGLIIAEVQKIINGDITEEEINTAKDYVISTFREIEDNKESQNRFILSNEILFEKEIQIEDIIKNISNIEKEDITNIAKKINIQKIFLLGGRQND